MSNPSVLLIEDDFSTAEILTLMLETRGYTVETSDTARDCIEKLSSQNYDIAIMDMMLPGMTTEQLISAVEKLPSHPPILVHSARPRNELVKYGRRLGAAGFLQKPVDMDTFLGQVESAARCSATGGGG